MTQTTCHEHLRLACVGLSHHNTPIELRERLAFGQQDIAHALQQLKQNGIHHAVVVSTCNRVEIYATATHIQNTLKKLVDFLARYHNIPLPTLQGALYQLQEQKALQHLFCVAASLDSMAVGEPQILGQLKQAYNLAHKANTVDSHLHQVFSHAFCVSKSIRTHTRIGENPVRLGSAAVQIAKNSLNHLKDRRVLLVGAGKVSNLVAPYLQREGVQLHILNRCENSAKILAQRHNAQPHPLHRLPSLLAHADLLVSSASCARNILTTNMLQASKHKNPSHNTPFVVIDLSVPRSVEPQVASCKHTQLYNLDHVHTHLQQATHKRRQEAMRAQTLIQEEVKKFTLQTRQQHVTPLVKKLRENATELAQKEAERLIRSLGPLSPSQQCKIQTAAHRIVNKMLHKPITQLKSLASKEDKQAQDKLQTIQSLFGE